MGLIYSIFNIETKIEKLIGFGEDDLNRLWILYNQLGDSFALDESTWSRLMIQSVRHVSADDIMRLAKDSFHLFDTDHNGLIDAFEAIGVVCMLSSTSWEFRCKYLFTMYNLDTSKKKLSRDELTMLLRNTSRGLLKIAQGLDETTMSDFALERLTNATGEENGQLEETISWERFLAFITTKTDIAKFCEAFEDTRPWGDAFEIDNTNIAQPESSYFTSLEYMSSTDKTTLEKQQLKLDKDGKQLWKELIVETEPSTLPKTPPISFPWGKLQLQHAIGFQDSSAAFYDLKGEHIIYCAGSKLVKQRIVDSTQYFFHGHKGMVQRCVPTASLTHVASVAETSTSNPELIVWDMEHCTLMTILNSVPFAQIHDLSFGGPNNSLLVVLGKSTHDIKSHCGVTIAVYQYQQEIDAIHIARIPFLQDAHQIEFSQQLNSTQFVVISKNYAVPVLFDLLQIGDRFVWKHRRGVVSLTKPARGILSVFSLKTPLRVKNQTTSGDLDADTVSMITCDTDGNIIWWNRCIPVKKFCINTPLKEPKPVSLGFYRLLDRDVYCTWSNEILQLWSLDLTQKIKYFDDTPLAHLTGLDIFRDGCRFLATSNSNCILQKSVAFDGKLETKVCMYPFNAGACAVVPKNPNDLLLVDKRSNQILGFPLRSEGTAQIDQSFRQSITQLKTLSNIAYSANGALVVITGDDINDAPILMVLYKDPRPVESLKIFKEVFRASDFDDDQILSICMSLDCAFLAVCTGSGKLRVYDLKVIYAHALEPGIMGDRPYCIGSVNLDFCNDTNLGAIMVSMDFSRDVTHLRIECSTRQNALINLVHVHIPTVKVVSSGIKDISWSNATCSHVWGSHGTFPPDNQASPTVCSSCFLDDAEIPLVITGTLQGEISTYLWPTMLRNSTKSVSISHPAHGCSVQRVGCWNTEGIDMVYSFSDNTMFIWKIAHTVDRCNLQPEATVSLHIEDYCALLGDIAPPEPENVPYPMPRWLDDVPAPSSDLFPETEVSLHLRHIHGVNHLVNGASYIFNPSQNTNEILYTAGRFIVVLHPEHRTQRFVGPMKGRPTSIAVQRSTFAVGDSEGNILLYHIENLSIVASWSLDTKAVTSISFSNANYLGYVSGGCELIVVDIERDGVAYRQVPTGQKLYNSAWHPRDVSKISMTGDFFGSVIDIVDGFEGNFWSPLDYTDPKHPVRGGVLTSHTWFSGSQVVDPILVAGDAKGQLYTFRHRKLLHAHEEAHVGAITQLRNYVDELVMSCGIDGFVKLWKFESSGNPIILNQIDTTEFLVQDPLSTPRVLAVDMTGYSIGNARRKILILNSYSQILEIDVASQQLVANDDGDQIPQMDTHSGTSCCVACHPERPTIIATVSSDQVLYVSEVLKSGTSTLSFLNLPGPACVVTFSHDGKLLGISLLDGQFLIVEIENLQRPSIAYHSDQTATTEGYISMKFAMDNTTFGLATGRELVFYSFQNQECSRLGQVTSHQQVITGFDISSCSRYVQSIDRNGVVVYYDLKVKAEVKNIPMNAIKWVDHSVGYGPEYRALWKAGDDHTIEAMRELTISKISFVSLSSEPRKFRLYSLPCTSKYSVYDTHEGFVKSIAATVDGTQLFTTDTMSQCFLQWEIAVAEKLNLATEEGSKSDLTLAGDWKWYSVTPVHKQQEAEVELHHELVQRNKKYPAPRGSHGQLTGVPPKCIVLDHVYGHNSNAGSPLCNRLGDVILAAESSVVIWNIASNNQIIVQLPIGEISQMATDPFGRFVACIGKGSSIVCVIDACSGALCCTVSVETPPTSVDFAADGQTLCVVSLGSYCVYTYRSQGNMRHLAWKSAQLHSVTSVIQVPEAHSIKCMGASTCIILGRRHVGFVRRLDLPQCDVVVFAIPPKPKFKKKQADLQFICVEALKADTSICVVSTNCKTMMQFTQDGLRQGKVVEYECENDAIIDAMCSLEQKPWIVTGDTQGVIRVWDGMELVELKSIVPSIDLHQSLSPPLRYVMTRISLSHDDVGIIIGCVSGEIYRASLDTGQLQRLTAAHQSQHASMDLAPTGNVFVSVGEDGVLHKWDTTKCELLESRSLSLKLVPVRCVCWSPDGHTIAVGFGPRVSKDSGKTGTFLALDSESLNIVGQGPDSKDWALDILFSPSCSILGVADNNGQILLHETANGYKLSATCKVKKSKKMLVRFDFESEGSFLRCIDTDYQLYIFNCDSGELVNDTEKLMRECTWTSSNCLMGFDVQGFWHKDTDVPLWVSASNTFAIAGMKSGTLELAHYPCSKLGGVFTSRSVKAHLASVPKVCYKNNTILSTGATDGSIFQWRLQHEF